MEQLNQNVQVEEGVSLMDIIRLLLSKIKLLILVVIIGGLLGASFAVWKTIDINYFGTKVEFYVNPEKPEESSGTNIGPAAGGSQYGVYGAYGRHVMDNMVKLLSSDSFAEQLLLNGEKLPDTTIEWFSPEEKTEDGELMNDVLKKAVEAAQKALDEVATKEAAYNQALEAKTAALLNLSTKEKALQDTWKDLYKDKKISTTSAYFTEKAYYELASCPSILEDAYNDFDEAQGLVDSASLTVSATEKAWKDEKTAATKGDESPIEIALNIWRKSPKYAPNLRFYKSAISYDYLESNVDTEEANNLARSFIYVRISVQNSNFDKGLETGDLLLQRVKKVVPRYIEENMTVPDGYIGTNCQRITRTDDVHLTNPGYTTNQAIKYGLLAAVAAFVVACVVIIILDKSDKRLRDTEVIVRKLNVPLLGIVPTIEELKTEQSNKNKSAEVK